MMFSCCFAPSAENDTDQTTFIRTPPSQSEQARTPPVLVRGQSISRHIHHGKPIVAGSIVAHEDVAHHVLHEEEPADIFDLVRFIVRPVRLPRKRPRFTVLVRRMTCGSVSQ